MSPTQNIDRGILVFSIWGAFGFLGLCFLLEGFSEVSYLVSLAGITLMVASFVAHIVVNAVFNQGFTSGETALGIGSFGILALVFVIGWAEGGMPMANFFAGLTLFGVLAAGLLVYLSTRYGLRGAFSRFHVKQTVAPEAGR